MLCANGVVFAVEINLEKLDADMIKLLAWQRIQQLFPPKVPSPQTSISPMAVLKNPPALPDSKTATPPSHPAFASASVGAGLKPKLFFTGQKKVQARAVFYPLTGKGQAVNMCYRTLYIGSGKAQQVHVDIFNVLLCWGMLTLLFHIFDTPANATIPPLRCLKVPTWMCALPITVIATTYPANTPVSSTMRYVAGGTVSILQRGISG